MASVGLANTAQISPAIAAIRTTPAQIAQEVATRFFAWMDNQSVLDWAIKASPLALAAWFQFPQEAENAGKIAAVALLASRVWCSRRPSGTWIKEAASNASTQILSGALSGLGRTLSTPMIKNLGDTLHAWRQSPSGMDPANRLAEVLSQARDAQSPSEALSAVFGFFQTAPVSIAGRMLPPTAAAEEKNNILIEEAKQIASNINNIALQIKVAASPAHAGASSHAAASETFIYRLSTQVVLSIIFDNLLGASLSLSEQVELIKNPPDLLDFRIRERIADRPIALWKKKLALWMLTPCLRFITFCVNNSARQVFAKMYSFLSKQNPDPAPFFLDLAAYLSTLSSCYINSTDKKSSRLGLFQLIEQELELNQQQEAGYSSSTLYRLASDVFLQQFAPKVNWYSSIRQSVNSWNLSQFSVLRFLKLEPLLKQSAVFCLYLFVLIPEQIMNTALSWTLRGFARWFNVLEEFVNSYKGGDDKNPSNHIALRHTITAFIFSKVEQMCAQVKHIYQVEHPKTINEIREPLTSQQHLIDNIKNAIRHFYEAIHCSKYKTRVELDNGLNRPAWASQFIDNTVKKFLNDSLDEISLMIAAGIREFNQKNQKAEFIYQLLEIINASFISDKQVSNKSLADIQAALREKLVQLINLAIQIPVERVLDPQGRMQQEGYVQTLEELKTASNEFQQGMSASINQATRSIASNRYQDINYVNLVEPFTKFTSDISTLSTNVKAAPSLRGATKQHMHELYFLPIFRHYPDLQQQAKILNSIRFNLKHTLAEQQADLTQTLLALSNPFNEAHISYYLGHIRMVLEVLSDNNPLQVPLARLALELEDYEKILSIKAHLQELKLDVRKPEFKFQEATAIFERLLAQAEALQEFKPSYTIWQPALRAFTQEGTLRRINEKGRLDTSLAILIAKIDEALVTNSSPFTMDSHKAIIMDHATKLAGRGLGTAFDERKIQAFLLKTFNDLTALSQAIEKTIRGFRVVAHQNIAFPIGSGVLSDAAKEAVSWVLTNPIFQMIDFWQLPYNISFPFNWAARKIAADRLPKPATRR